MNILLLGPPGAGKGTQAKVLSKSLNIPIISMGDMLREIIKHDEELKEKVFPYMSSGKLVPDEIVGEILKKRVLKKDCENGFILDGYPRNKEQAKLLENVNIKIDKVVEISVGDEEILNVNFNKPKVEGVCDYCKGDLVLRPDDEEETIKKRLKVFREQTKPLEEFYGEQKKFFVVDGEKEADWVQQQLLNIVKEKAND